MRPSPKYLPKDIHKLKDRELAEQLFPKRALDSIKAELTKNTIRKPTSK
jgi:hypothetical protein